MSKVESDSGQTSNCEGQKHSLRVGLTKAGADRLAEVQKLAGKDSMAATVRDALRVYDILVTEVNVKGSLILLADQAQGGKVVKLRLF